MKPYLDIRSFKCLIHCIRSFLMSHLKPGSGKQPLRLDSTSKACLLQPGRLKLESLAQVTLFHSPWYQRRYRKFSTPLYRKTPNCYDSVTPASLAFPLCESGYIARSLRSLALYGAPLRGLGPFPPMKKDFHYVPSAEGRKLWEASTHNGISRVDGDVFSRSVGLTPRTIADLPVGRTFWYW
jgi:hypothetical protein